MIDKDAESEVSYISWLEKISIMHVFKLMRTLRLISEIVTNNSTINTDSYEKVAFPKIYCLHLNKIIAINTYFVPYFHFP